MVGAEPGVSCTWVSMRGRKRLWRWRLHRAGSTTVVCCRPCWIRFRVASFKSRATGPMTRGPVINRYSSGRLVATIPPRRSARLSESVDPPAWRAMRDAHLRRQRGEYGIGFAIYRQTDDGHRGGDFERSGKAGETKQGPHTVRIMAPDNSRSVAGATVYVYTFLLATPYKDRGPHEYQ